MVDNTTLPTGTGGDVIGSDDIGGVKFQRVKLIHGADGVNAGDVATANGLPVVQVSNSLVSTGNSTAVNLAGAAVFTGAWEDVSEYSNIAVTVFSSHVSATDGLSMQQSSDGVNADLTDVYTVPAASGKIFHLGVAARFYRLVYTNGATLTTSLRIQTLYSKATKRGSSVRPGDARGNDNDLEEVSAFLVGYDNATNQHNRLRSTIANGLAVDVTRLSPLVAGTAAIGTVGVTSLPALVAGAAAIGTVGVTSLPALVAGAAAIGTVGVTSLPALVAGAAAIGTVAINAAIPTGANTIGAVTGPAAAPLALDASLINHTQRLQSTTLAVTVTAAANTGATATLPAVAGQFHYITGIEIMRTSTAALAGTATLVVTTTNLPGGLAWSFGNAMAAGASQRDLTITFPNPIKSTTVNTASTVVMPLPGAAVLWRANVYYYTAA